MTHLRTHWVEYAGLAFAAYMLLFAFPALFNSYAQAWQDRQVLERFER